MKTKLLSDHQIELAVARAMGYHARMPRNSNVPYVMIDDWNKPGTVINGCRFNPLKDPEIANEVARGLNVKSKHFSDDSNNYWIAGMITESVELVTYVSHRSREDAILRCIIAYTYGTEIPDLMLEDNPL